MTAVTDLRAWQFPAGSFYRSCTFVLRLFVASLGSKSLPAVIRPRITSVTRMIAPQTDSIRSLLVMQLTPLTRRRMADGLREKISPQAPRLDEDGSKANCEGQTPQPLVCRTTVWRHIPHTGHSHVGIADHRANDNDNKERPARTSNDKLSSVLNDKN